MRNAICEVMQLGGKGDGREQPMIVPLCACQRLLLPLRVGGAWNMFHLFIKCAFHVLTACCQQV